MCLFITNMWWTWQFILWTLCLLNHSIRTTECVFLCSWYKTRYNHTQHRKCGTLQCFSFYHWNPKIFMNNVPFKSILTCCTCTCTTSLARIIQLNCTQFCFCLSPPSSAENQDRIGKEFMINGTLIIIMSATQHQYICVGDWRKYQASYNLFLNSFFQAILSYHRQKQNRWYKNPNYR